jgi:DNA-binding Lrp family transcriptional regulator
MQNWVSGNPVPVTHEVLAMMLGAWRPNVSDALAALEQEGIIARTRGAIRILDEPALASQACDCYCVVDAKFRSAWPTRDAGAKLVCSATRGVVHTIAIRKM